MCVCTWACIGLAPILNVHLIMYCPILNGHLIMYHTCLRPALIWCGHVPCTVGWGPTYHSENLEKTIPTKVSAVLDTYRYAKVAGTKKMGVSLTVWRLVLNMCLQKEGFAKVPFWPLKSGFLVILTPLLLQLNFPGYILFRCPKTIRAL